MLVIMQWYCYTVTNCSLTPHRCLLVVHHSISLMTVSHSYPRDICTCWHEPSICTTAPTQHIWPPGFCHCQPFTCNCFLHSLHNTMLLRLHSDFCWGCTCSHTKQEVLSDDVQYYTCTFTVFPCRRVSLATVAVINSARIALEKRAKLKSGTASPSTPQQAQCAKPIMDARRLLAVSDSCSAVVRIIANSFWLLHWVLCNSSIIKYCVKFSLFCIY